MIIAVDPKIPTFFRAESETESSLCRIDLLAVSRFVGLVEVISFRSEISCVEFDIGFFAKSMLQSRVKNPVVVHAVFRFSAEIVLSFVLFRDDVDNSADSVASVFGRRRTFNDFDLFDIVEGKLRLQPQ